MTKTIAALALVVVSLTGASAAFAKDSKKARPTVCERFTVAKDGKEEIGICASKKEGGRSSVLRTFKIVTLSNPEDGSAVEVMIGYR